MAKMAKKFFFIVDLKMWPQDQHIYAEGPDLLISDILLYPCIYLVLQSQAGV